MNKYVQLLVWLGMLLITANASAYDLNGILQRDYSVILSDSQGHTYYGYSEDEDDGTLDISVQDDRGVVYNGVATEIGNGMYSLDLESDTGGQASGLLQEK